MAKINLKHIEAGIRFFLTISNSELKIGEKIVLITIIRLLNEQHVVSKLEVCQINKGKRDTTYSLIRSLETKGYLTSVRGNQFYSRSYITLTDQGLLYASKLKRFISSH